MKGLFLVNLGTPDAPTTKSVRNYLRQFLSDPCVIDLPSPARWLLLNLFILPFRSPRSARLYQHIWTKEGSPLAINTQALRDQLRQKLGSRYVIEIGMRYGNPSITEGLTRMAPHGVSELKLLPLFPQKTQSSWGTAVREVQHIAREMKGIPTPLVLKPFFDHPGFIESFVSLGQKAVESIRPDHLLFSFHGLPMRQIKKGDSLYPDQCRTTARLIADRLGFKEYSVTFQSRMGVVKWLAPYTDQEILKRIQSGKKRFVVFAPAFVTDCLETLEELGIRYRELALHNGAEAFHLVPSLNATPEWVKAVSEMIETSS